MKNGRDKSDLGRRDAGIPGVGQPQPGAGKRTLVEASPVAGRPVLNALPTATPAPVPDDRAASPLGIGKQTRTAQLSGTPTASSPSQRDGARPTSATSASSAPENASAQEDPMSLDGLEAALGSGDAPTSGEARLAQHVGADPSAIRVHRGPAAAQAAAQHGAVAFAGG